MKKGSRGRAKMRSDNQPLTLLDKIEQVAKQLEYEELSEVDLEQETQPMTLLDAIEQIAEQAEDSALSEGYFKRVAHPISQVSERLQLTEKQTVLLALLTNFYNEWNTLSELTEYTGCKRLQMLRYASEMNLLRRSV